jgi:hypothetical protein
MRFLHNPLGVIASEAKTHFGRIAEMDVLYVHPKGEGQGGPESQFGRIDELDEFCVRPEGEGHGWPESYFGRIAEMDVLYVHPKGEGQGGPESLPITLIPLRLLRCFRSSQRHIMKL